MSIVVDKFAASPMSHICFSATSTSMRMLKSSGEEGKSYLQRELVVWNGRFFF
jgi:hypothetical protein